jgi:hypothetical protein
VIPRAAHFVWLGADLPWVHLLAVASSARFGGFERVVLHHTDALADAPQVRALTSLERVSVARLDPEALLEQAGVSALVDTYRELRTPAAKSNVLRVALLHEHGGVYLDTDTITLRSFEPLAARAGVFVGEERLVFPVMSRTSAVLSSPVALVRTAARDFMRRLPEGYRAFRRVERFYPTAVNNAVIGSEPRHPFLADLLSRMKAVPRERRTVRYALGTHLLQQAARGYRGPGLHVLPPPVFFPLGPEISEHWFRTRAVARLDDVIVNETILVHWYASVRTRSHVERLNPSFIRAHAHNQLFSALALPTVEALASR